RGRSARWSGDHACLKISDLRFEIWDLGFEITDFHDNGLSPQTGEKPGTSCRQSAGSCARGTGAGSHAVRRASRRTLPARWRYATGSDWQPATLAGRTIAWILPAGRDHG